MAMNPPDMASKPKSAPLGYAPNSGSWVWDGSKWSWSSNTVGAFSASGQTQNMLGGLGVPTTNSSHITSQLGPTGDFGATGLGDTGQGSENYKKNVAWSDAANFGNDLKRANAGGNPWDGYGSRNGGGLDFNSLPMGQYPGSGFPSYAGGGQGSRLSDQLVPRLEDIRMQRLLQNYR